jgi:xylulokinase
MSYVLGLDLGTSSLKGLLFRQDGVLVGEASADYPLLTPQAGYSEQNPAEWRQAAHKVLKTLVSEHEEIKKELVGISFSGQMHSLVY